MTKKPAPTIMDCKLEINRDGDIGIAFQIDNAPPPELRARIIRAFNEQISEHLSTGNLTVDQARAILERVLRQFRQ